MLMQVPKRIISGQPRIRNREESLIEMIRYKHSLTQSIICFELRSLVEQTCGVAHEVVIEHSRVW